ncbi:unnamed protein product [Prunus armeniaca]|uniref:Uncharacterized protein n=1 Tax=Prunus armeniaca TaxID=36596 RepID=A0A6J5VKD0_PRUAR|nr:unnamed protein product [Prunus armeniaca]
MEEQGNNEVDASDDNDTSPMSINKEGRQFVASQNNGKIGSSDEDRIVTTLEYLFEISGKNMQMVTDAFLKGSDDEFFH